MVRYLRSHISVPQIRQGNRKIGGEFKKKKSKNTQDGWASANPLLLRFVFVILKTPFLGRQAEVEVYADLPLELHSGFKGTG